MLTLRLHAGLVLPPPSSGHRNATAAIGEPPTVPGRVEVAGKLARFGVQHPEATAVAAIAGHRCKRRPGGYRLGCPRAPASRASAGIEAATASTAISDQFATTRAPGRARERQRRRAPSASPRASG